MGVTEIVLLIIGIAFFVASFFLPDGKSEQDEYRDDEKRIRELVDKQIESAKERIEDMVDETVNYSIEKTERALERLSNEKIMAVDEYSETVLKKINDNHNEAVFLYDMLNDKDEKLKNSGDELKAKDEELKAKSEELRARDEALREQEELRAQEEKKAEERRKAEAARIAEEEARLAYEEERNRELRLQFEEEQRKMEAERAFAPLDPEKVYVIEGEGIIEPVSEVLVNAPTDNKEVKEPKTTKAKTSNKTAKAQTKTNKASKSDDEPGLLVSFQKGEEIKKNKNDEIRRLHDEGKSNMAIAKELGLGVGEVKLVLDLFSSRK